MSDARHALRCINEVRAATDSLTFLKRISVTNRFNRGMEFIASAMSGITPRWWIAIVIAVVAVLVAIAIAIGIAWLLAYAD